MVKGNLKALPSKSFGFFVTGKYKVDIEGRITDVDHVYTNDFLKAKDPNSFVNVRMVMLLLLAVVDENPKKFSKIRTRSEVRIHVREGIRINI